MATQWIRSDDVIWEELNEGALLVSPATHAQWSLNATAAAIWKLCDGTLNMSELAHRFAKVSGRCLQRAQQEIAEFCDAFASLGLLHSSSGALAQPAGLAGAAFRCDLSSPPSFRSLGLGASGPRRRPSPRGNSGPG